MAKFAGAFCILLALFYTCLGVIAAEALKSHGRDCPKGIPPSVCNKRISFFPFPRVGRRMDPTFARSMRGFGLIKQPRIGRSDPGLSEFEDDASWMDVAAPETNHAGYPFRGLEEKEENLKNLENYLSAQRRDSNAPWAFFLITPNFQSMDQQQAMDNLISQIGHESDLAVNE